MIITFGESAERLFEKYLPKPEEPTLNSFQVVQGIQRRARQARVYATYCEQIDAGLNEQDAKNKTQEIEGCSRSYVNASIRGGK